MEVLARYCSIPGYKKLCCESCGKRSGNFPLPFYSEAAETEEGFITSPAVLPKSLVTPTSLVPPCSERQSASGRMSLTEDNTQVLLSPIYKRLQAANNPSHRRFRSQASNKMPGPAALHHNLSTNDGLLLSHRSSTLFDTGPVATHHPSSVDIHSSPRTPRRNEKRAERQQPLRSSTIRR
ncbi:A disintegrin and metalloproteinase with thrombospondin motifs 3, partial [Ophiophagus hannah]